jgi:hypothetical protein
MPWDVQTSTQSAPAEAEACVQMRETPGARVASTQAVSTQASHQRSGRNARAAEPAPQHRDHGVAAVFKMKTGFSAFLKRNVRYENQCFMPP